MSKTELGTDRGIRGGTSQDFSGSSHASQSQCDLRVRAKGAIGAVLGESVIFGSPLQIVIHFCIS